MAHAPTLDDPNAFGATKTPEVQETRTWPSGWWILPAIGFGLWAWIRIFTWLLF